MEFLLFYGFQMDYVCEAIIIHPPGFAEKPVFSIYQLPNTIVTIFPIQDLTPKLIIYDPLNPVNNVGRATYRVLTLKVTIAEFRNSSLFGTIVYSSASASLRTFLTEVANSYSKTIAETIKT